MTRSLLKSKRVPGRLWGEAATTVVYLLNRALTKSVIGMTPYEALYKRKPNVHHQRTFGCVVHVKTAVAHLTKLQDRSTPMVFLGDEPGSKAYRVYDPKNCKLHVSRDVHFQEKWNWDSDANDDGPQQPGGEFFIHYETNNNAGADKNHGVDLPAVDEAIGHDATLPADASPATSAGPITPTTSPQPPIRTRSLFNIYDNTTEVELDLDQLLLASEEPASFVEAMKQECWKDAMQDELKSIDDNATWNVVELPHGHKAIGLKWVFKVKKDSHGASVKHKARL